jgi:hypothetical protein
MNINLYNSQKSKVGIANESTYIHPNLIIADKVFYGSFASEAVLIYKYLDELPDIFILSLAMAANHDNPEQEKRAKDLIDMAPSIKKIKNKKHKDKRMLTALGQYKQLLGYFKADVRDFYTESLTKFHLIELIPFVDTEIWNLDIFSPEFDHNNESKLITGIADTLINRNAFLSLDHSIDKLFRFSTAEPADNSKCDFIKIPLWAFPPITVINYEQMKYTRDQLKPFLDPFKKELQDLSDDLFKIIFTKDHFLQIKKMCTDRLIPLKANIQHEIHESLYLSRLRNSYPGNFGVEFCLGITDAETIVNYYEKTNIIEPYMASEIKQRINRQADLKATQIFTYFELHGARSV